MTCLFWLGAERHGPKRRPIDDFSAVLTHLRDINAEIARLSIRVDGLEENGAQWLARQSPADGMLHETIADSFNSSELNELEARLAINPDELIGDGLKDEALKLVLYMRRRGKLNALLAELQRVRPHIRWENYR